MINNSNRRQATSETRTIFLTLKAAKIRILFDLMDIKPASKVATKVKTNNGRYIKTRISPDSRTKMSAIAVIGSISNMLTTKSRLSRKLRTKTATKNKRRVI